MNVVLSTAWVVEFLKMREENGNTRRYEQGGVMILGRYVLNLKRSVKMSVFKQWDVIRGEGGGGREVHVGS